MALNKRELEVCWYALTYRKAALESEMGLPIDMKDEALEGLTKLISRVDDEMKSASD